MITNTPIGDDLAEIAGTWGHPWHGLCTNGVLDTGVPNPSNPGQNFTRTYPQPLGGHTMIVDAGAPAVVRSAQEQEIDAANGYQWPNYATLSGRNHNLFGVPLGKLAWIYIDADKQPWRVWLHDDAGAGITDSGMTGTVYAQRYGVIGKTHPVLSVGFSVTWTDLLYANNGLRPVFQDATRDGHMAAFLIAEMPAYFTRTALILEPSVVNGVLSVVATEHGMRTEHTKAWVQEISDTVIGSARAVGLNCYLTCCNIGDGMVPIYEKSIHDVFNSTLALWFDIAGQVHTMSLVGRKGVTSTVNDMYWYHPLGGTLDVVPQVSVSYSNPTERKNQSVVQVYIAVDGVSSGVGYWSTTEDVYSRTISGSANWQADYNCWDPSTHQQTIVDDDTHQTTLSGDTGSSAFLLANQYYVYTGGFFSQSFPDSDPASWGELFEDGQYLYARIERYDSHAYGVSIASKNANGMITQKTIKHVVTPFGVSSLNHTYTVPVPSYPYASGPATTYDRQTEVAYKNDASPVCIV